MKQIKPVQGPRKKVINIGGKDGKIKSKERAYLYGKRKNYNLNAVKDCSNVYKWQWDISFVLNSCIY